MSVNEENQPSEVVGSRFAQMPGWVLFSKVSDRAIRLYALLQWRAGQAESSWPSHRSLAREMDCSIASVKRAIAELVEIRAVRVVTRRRDDGQQTSNAYIIRADQPQLTGEPPTSSPTNPLPGSLVNHQEPDKEEPDKLNQTTQAEPAPLELLDLSAPTVDPSTDELRFFEQDVWPHYPSPKKDKRNALKAYRAQRNRGVARDRLVVATKNYAADVERRRPEWPPGKSFVLNGSTFYNGRWEEFEEAPQPNVQAVKHSDKTGPDWAALREEFGGK